MSWQFWFFIMACVIIQVDFVLFMINRQKLKKKEAEYKQKEAEYIKQIAYLKLYGSVKIDNDMLGSVSLLVDEHDEEYYKENDGI